MKEPGWRAAWVFQSGVNSEKLVLLERWTDQAALDPHSKLNSTRPSFPL
jgi:quinol monooxygenase YgiN